MANNKNNPKRDHHVLPELYLKGFVIKKDEPFIWVYKRGEQYNPGQGKITNNPFKNSIRRTTVERDFYADPLARIFHSGIEQRSGESVRRLDITQPNENAIHRFFYDRL